MEQKICLDTSVIIAHSKNDARVSTYFDAEREKRAVISAVTLFELLLRQRNLEEMEALLKGVEILPFDEAAARAASRIEKELKAKGTPMGIRDVFIAATAMAHGCVVATLNAKDFQKINGVNVVGV